MLTKNLITRPSTVAVVLLQCFIYSASTQDVDKPCTKLQGAWFNDLGARIELIQSDDDKLIGKYWMTADQTNGTLTTGPSDVFGTTPYKAPGSTFGFGVMMQSGQSITAWTGQCLVCGDEEVLVTAWLMRSRVASCADKWKSTLIGQNKFKRSQPAANKRKRRYIEQEVSKRYYRSTSLDQSIVDKAACTLDGYWYNELGSEMLISSFANNYITGEYRTAVERCKGAAGTSFSKLYGVTNTTQLGSVVSFYVVWSNGSSITEWVGQCHQCGPNGTEVLQTTWLLRSKVASCGDNWKSTYYGEDFFTRYDQKSGPRKHEGTDTPGQADPSRVRRETDSCSANDANSNLSTTFFLFLSLFSFLFV